MASGVRLENVPRQALSRDTALGGESWRRPNRERSPAGSRGYTRVWGKRGGYAEAAGPSRCVAGAYDEGGAVPFAAEEEPGPSDRAHDGGSVGLPCGHLGRLEATIFSTPITLGPRRGQASRERWPQQPPHRQPSQHPWGTVLSVVGTSNLYVSMHMARSPWPLVFLEKLGDAGLPEEGAA